MKSFILSIILFTISIASYSAIDKKDFYYIFSTGNLTQVNTYIKTLQSTKTSSQTNAYLGAMLMKKAGLEQSIQVKLESFKTGCKLLETEIAKYPNNAEFRFLRITVQEIAPVILGYYNNIEEDKKIIIQGYQKMDPFLQSCIIEYCKKSEVLTIKDFQ